MPAAGFELEPGSRDFAAYRGARQAPGAARSRTFGTRKRERQPLRFTSVDHRTQRPSVPRRRGPGEAVMASERFLNAYHNASTAPSPDVPADLAGFMLAADRVLADRRRR